MRELMILIGVAVAATSCRHAAQAQPAEPHAPGEAEVFLQRCFRYQAKNDVVQSGGRFAGPFEFRGVCVRGPDPKHEEIGLLEKTGTFESEWKSRSELLSCSVKSVTTVTWKSGSFTGEGVSTCELGPDGKLVFKSDGVLVRGTGVYEGIQGTTSAQVNVVSAGPPELDYDVVEVRYSVPGK